jgi:hypothetical protein
MMNVCSGAVQVLLVTETPGWLHLKVEGLPGSMGITLRETEVVICVKVGEK